MTDIAKQTAKIVPALDSSDDTGLHVGQHERFSQGLNHALEQLEAIAGAPSVDETTAWLAPVDLQDTIQRLVNVREVFRNNPEIDMHMALPDRDLNDWLSSTASSLIEFGSAYLDGSWQERGWGKDLLVTAITDLASLTGGKVMHHKTEERIATVDLSEANLFEQLIEPPSVQTSVDPGQQPTAVEPAVREAAPPAEDVDSTAASLFKKVHELAKAFGTWARETVRESGGALYSLFERAVDRLNRGTQVKNWDNPDRSDEMGAVNSARVDYPPEVSMGRVEHSRRAVRFQQDLSATEVGVPVGGSCRVVPLRRYLASLAPEIGADKVAQLTALAEKTRSVRPLNAEESQFTIDHSRDMAIQELDINAGVRLLPRSAAYSVIALSYYDSSGSEIEPPAGGWTLTEGVFGGGTYTAPESAVKVRMVLEGCAPPDISALEPLLKQLPEPVVAFTPEEKIVLDLIKNARVSESERVALLDSFIGGQEYKYVADPRMGRFLTAAGENALTFVNSSRAGICGPLACLAAAQQNAIGLTGFVASGVTKERGRFIINPGHMVAVGVASGGVYETDITKKAGQDRLRDDVPAGRIRRALRNQDLSDCMDAGRSIRQRLERHGSKKSFFDQDGKSARNPIAATARTLDALTYYRSLVEYVERSNNEGDVRELIDFVANRKYEHPTSDDFSRVSELHTLSGINIEATTAAALLQAGSNQPDNWGMLTYQIGEMTQTVRYSRMPDSRKLLFGFEVNSPVVSTAEWDEMLSDTVLDTMPQASLERMASLISTQVATELTRGVRVGPLLFNFHDQQFREAAMGGEVRTGFSVLTRVASRLAPPEEGTPASRETEEFLGRVALLASLLDRGEREGVFSPSELSSVPLGVSQQLLRTCLDNSCSSRSRALVQLALDWPAPLSEHLSAVVKRAYPEGISSETAAGSDQFDAIVAEALDFDSFRLGSALKLFKNLEAIGLAPNLTRYQSSLRKSFRKAVNQRTSFDKEERFGAAPLVNYPRDATPASRMGIALTRSDRTDLVAMAQYLVKTGGLSEASAIGIFNHQSERKIAKHLAAEMKIPSESGPIRGMLNGMSWRNGGLPVTRFLPAMLKELAVYEDRIRPLIKLAEASTATAMKADEQLVNEFCERHPREAKQLQKELVQATKESPENALKGIVIDFSEQINRSFTTVEQLAAREWMIEVAGQVGSEQLGQALAGFRSNIARASNDDLQSEEYLLNALSESFGSSPRIFGSVVPPLLCASTALAASVSYTVNGSVDPALRNDSPTSRGATQFAAMVSNPEVPAIKGSRSLSLVRGGTASGSSLDLTGLADEGFKVSGLLTERGMLQVIPYSMFVGKARQGRVVPPGVGGTVREYRVGDDLRYLDKRGLGQNQLRIRIGEQEANGKAFIVVDAEKLVRDFEQRIDKERHAFGNEAAPRLSPLTEMFAHLHVLKANGLSCDLVVAFRDRFVTLPGVTRTDGHSVSKKGVSQFEKPDFLKSLGDQLALVQSQTKAEDRFNATSCTSPGVSLDTIAGEIQRRSTGVNHFEISLLLGRSNLLALDRTGKLGALQRPTRSINCCEI